MIKNSWEQIIRYLGEGEALYYLALASGCIGSLCLMMAIAIYVSGK
jgi:hypothetical protein